VALDSTVAAAQPFGYQRWQIRLATGATWRTTEPSIGFDPRSGETVTIRRGAMSSYLLKVGKGRAVRAIRVN
jgi:hypothetical protein